MGAESLEDKKLPIVDKAAYDEYLKLRIHPILSPKKDRIVKLSDNDEIDLATKKMDLLSKIVHLSQEEIDDIMDKKDLYITINSKCMNAKRKAYGVKTGGRKAGGGILDKKGAEIIELFGRMFTINEVFETITKEWKIPISIEAVRNFRKTHIEAISMKIEEFKVSYQDIRLSTKRGRIEELAMIYAVRRSAFLESGSREDQRSLVAVLDQIRKETDPDNVIVQNGININITNVVETHIQQELAASLPLREVILCRVAAKNGTTPTNLLHSLAVSNYAKVTGYHPDGIDPNHEISYPSQETYDFDKIKRANEKKEVQIELSKDSDGVFKTPEIKSELDKIRDALSQKLKSSQAKNDTDKNNIRFT